MDVVYVNKDGENLELRYSLRTLRNVDHDAVWIFGGAPIWINTDTVRHVRRRQAGSPYRSTREHILAACNTPEVSDPFMLWNDDFFAMKHVGKMPLLNRGPIAGVIESYANSKTPWVKGLRHTAAMLEEKGVKSISYDLHAPLIVYKAEMREAIRWANTFSRVDAIHVRTLYGNIVDLGGTTILDPKISRRSAPLPTGPWLSCSDETFRSTVEPILRYEFPDKSYYEKG